MKGKNCLWTLLILTFAVSITQLSLRVSAAEPTVTFKVEPYTTAGVPPGNLVVVNVSINAEPGAAIIGWKVNLKVQPDVLELGYTYGSTEYIAYSGVAGYTLYEWCIDYPWDPVPGEPPTIFQVGGVNKTEGTITETTDTVKQWTVLPEGDGANGTGLLVTFYFTSKNETAYSPIQITEAYYYTSWNAPNLDKRVPNIINGHYNEPPTIPPPIVHKVTVANQTYHVVTQSNSSVSNFAFDETYKMDTRRGETTFYVSGPAGTTGFCNITFPKNLTQAFDGWLVFVNNTSVVPTVQPNGNYTSLHFIYTHGDMPQLVQIYGTYVVPEFPTFTPLLLLLIAMLLTAAASKRVWSTKREETPPNRRGFVQFT